MALSPTTACCVCITPKTVCAFIGILIFIIAISSLTEVSSNRDSGYKDNPLLSPYISSPEECARVCKKGEPPKTCYWEFTLELYTTVGGACEICTPNATNVGQCQCVLADGYEMGFLVINRKLPGPAMRVCEGDNIVVDVKNSMEALETTIHWHGIFQRGTQYYDGVPMVTQCSFTQGDTFRYQFGTKNNAGTHWYHAHSGWQKGEGIFGSLVVLQAQSEDPHGYLYKHDLPEHVIMVSDWIHEYALQKFPGRVHNKTGQSPDNVLINGKGQFTDPETGIRTDTPIELFTVTHGEKYRFRLINTFSTICPAEITIEGHSLSVIATDGEPVKPVVANSIDCFAGETYDFILHANQAIGAYWIQVKGLGECGGDLKIQQLAILRYDTGPSEPSSPTPTYDDGLPQGVVLNPFGGVCERRSSSICISQLRHAKKVDESILQKVPDQQIVLEFGFYAWSLTEVFEPNNYRPYLVAPGGQAFVVSVVNNISGTMPPSPLISQMDDIPPDTFCNSEKKPKNCGNPPCLCAHKIDIKLGAIVEVILIDTAGIPTLSHPWHMHGYSFNIIGSGISPDENVTKISAEHCKKWDKQGLLKRNFDSPPGKDTIAVPINGYVIYRFKADNPGYWLLHCHFMYHLMIGMDVILHVGKQSDLPPVPENFPTCGLFKPPIIPIHGGY